MQICYRRGGKRQAPRLGGHCAIITHCLRKQKHRYLFLFALYGITHKNDSPPTLPCFSEVFEHYHLRNSHTLLKYKQSTAGERGKSRTEVVSWPRGV